MNFDDSDADPWELYQKDDECGSGFSQIGCNVGEEEDLDEFCFDAPSPPRAEGTCWVKSLYEADWFHGNSVYTEFVEAHSGGLDPCVLARPYSSNKCGKEFCLFTSRSSASRFVAELPPNRRHVFEKIMVGHVDAEFDCITKVRTTPYVDYDLKLSTLPEANFKLQTSNFKLQTSNFKIQISNFKLHSSNFKLQTSNFKLQTLHFKL